MGANIMEQKTEQGVITCPPGRQGHDPNTVQKENMGGGKKRIERVNESAVKYFSRAAKLG